MNSDQMKIQDALLNVMKYFDLTLRETKAEYLQNIIFP